MKQTAKRQWIKALKSAAFFAAYVGVFALVWTVAYKAVKNEYILPSLADILRATGRLFTEKFFYSAFWNSFLRVLWVFALSFVCALLCAVIAKLFPLFEKILAPIVTALRALPTMAIILILLIWSTPKDAPVIVAFLALFPMLYTGIFAALSTVDEGLVQMCKTYCVPLRKQIFQMYLPASLPYVLREAAGGISFGLKLIVSAEILANTYVGIGGMLQLSKIYMETPRMFALTLLVIAVGLVLEGIGIALSQYVERRVK